MRTIYSTFYTHYPKNILYSDNIGTYGIRFSNRLYLYEKYDFIGSVSFSDKDVMYFRYNSYTTNYNLIPFRGTYIRIGSEYYNNPYTKTIYECLYMYNTPFLYKELDLTEEELRYNTEFDCMETDKYLLFEVDRTLEGIDHYHQKYIKIIEKA